MAKQDKNNVKEADTEKKSNPKKDLSLLVNSLNKKYGDNTLIFGGKVNKPIERIPTGSVVLDIDLGGGIPIGRFTQISGALSSTKTTQTLHIVREAQRLGLVCLWADVEGTTDEEYMLSLGINTQDLIYIRPSGLEEVTQVILDVQKSGLVDVAVWDSIEASAPTKEYESNMEDTVQMGIKPKLMGEFFRKYQATNNLLERQGKRPFTLIAINQLREKIGAYGDWIVA